MIEFRDADERIAWDRFVAAMLASDPQNTTELCLGTADSVIEARRRREPPDGIMNFSTDETKAGPR
jgi:hypothetical protein